MLPYLPTYRFLKKKVRHSGISFSLRIFQFVVIHTVKGFSVVNEAEVFLEFLCFLYDPMNIIWSFLNPACISGSSWFMYYGSLSWQILSIALLVRKMSTIVRWFEHFLALPLYGIGMKTDLFHSCDHCWVFQICWQTECSTLIASSFRILNSSDKY